MICPIFSTCDPYPPLVKIPHNARERWGAKKRCMRKKRGLTLSEGALEKTQTLAFKLTKLAIARAHKASRKLIHPLTHRCKS